MKKIYLLGKWIIKAWPLLIVLALLIIQLLIFSFFEIDKGSVNAIVGPFLQLVGGFFVLLSINENIKDFRHINIFSMFTQYINSCPCIKHNCTLDAEPLTSESKMGKVSAFFLKQWNTNEEGLKELERRIEDLRKYVSDNNKDLREDLSAVQNKFNILVSKNNQEIKEVSSLLDKSVIGNIKYQILGILLIFYGSIVNIIQILNISKHN